MGSLENGIQSKRASFGNGRIDRSPFLHRPRSRFARFLLLEKVDYHQWVCAIVVFCLVVVLFQMYLPGSVMEKPGSSVPGRIERWRGNFEGISRLEFGDGIRFEPGRLLEKFREEAAAPVNSSVLLVRSGAIRKPQLALVFADQSTEAEKLLMVSVAAALLEMGYAIQVYSFEDGPAHIVWRSLGVPVTILQNSNKAGIAVDWLNYDGILVNSIETKSIFTCFLQEPFKSLPVVWTIHERELAIRAKEYSSNGQTQLIDEWKQAFNRATVVVFPNYFMPMMYSTFDTGNYFVIPGSPIQAWEVNAFMASNNGHDLRIQMDYEPDDFVIAIVGSEFSYSGLWLEHAFVLQALVHVFADFPSKNNSTSRLKLCILRGTSSSNYTTTVEAIALELGYSKGSVQHIGIEADVNRFLGISDLVLYGSFLEEQSFPEILIRAMCFGKPIVAPDLSIIKKYIDNNVNGLLFPKGDIGALTRVLAEAISEGKLSASAQHVASNGKGSARNLLVSEAIDGYSSLLANVLKFPSEVRTPKAVSEIPLRLKEEWQWHLFDENLGSTTFNGTDKSYRFLDDVEEKWNRSNKESLDVRSAMDEAFSYTDWEEEKIIDSINARRKQEDDELKDRTDQPHGTWEEVYRNARRIDRARNDLRERDDRELERTGQPLCIYEPYFGEGSWPFLHRTSLYRGIGLSTKGRRRGEDDVDAPSRLPILNTHYYRDILGEYGAFFAIANRIDRIHKNAWIGFQSWRATARKAALSTTAESALLHTIQKKKHGDALYFWVPMDKDPQSPSKWDFWTLCDSINAGNCRFAVSEALRRMYGIKRGLDTLPPMPADGSTWSVMHSWVMPTRSFLEFVMFSRMFVDALDAQMYDEHYQTGHCYLSLYKDRKCYSRVLELLVNVWAYHSARRMVYVNPETGAMQEQHRLKDRKGHMWIKWFSYTTLKSMDEDFAEEFDSDSPTRPWLWPATGEVFWQGMYEREKNIRQQQKEKRKQQRKDRISRMHKRGRQKAIGKYIKPPPEDVMDTNLTRTRL